MSLVVVVLLAALLLGWATGGSLDRLGSLPLRRRRLVPAALGVQLAGAVVGGPFHAVGLAASVALVVGFLVHNRGIRGTGLVALGLAANALVVAANGAMPVSVAAAERAGAPVPDVLFEDDPRHEPAGDGTRLRLLADVVPVPLPLRPEVVSVGDVLVAAGLGQLVLVGMRRQPAPGAPVAPVPVRARGGRPLRPLPPVPPGARRRPPGRGRPLPAVPLCDPGRDTRTQDDRRPAMAKKARKRRARKKNGANHGKRPNA